MLWWWLDSWKEPSTWGGGSRVLGGNSHLTGHTLHGAGEPYVTIKAYTAVEEDEVSLSEGEAIEVIHKLLDGWWVIR